MHVCLPRHLSVVLQLNHNLPCVSLTISKAVSQLARCVPDYVKAVSQLAKFVSNHLQIMFQLTGCVSDHSADSNPLGDLLH